ncbi:Uncharacterised protein [uncultured archaeon]|nr:Uncharacterised protein [uncultured archaeon]
MPENYYEIRIDDAPQGLDSFEKYHAHYKNNYSTLLKNKVFPCITKLVENGLIEDYHFLTHPKSYVQSLPQIEYRPIFDLRIKVLNPGNKFDEVKKILSNTFQIIAINSWGNDSDTKTKLTILHNVAEIVRSLIENGDLNLKDSENYELGIHWLCNAGLVDLGEESQFYLKRLKHLDFIINPDKA